MANAASIKKMFSGFRHIHVAIIGDIMVDKYVYGNVDRISPEAPVPVLDVKQKETRPGGAANVAVNIKALDATPYLFSVIGNDSEGDNLISLLKLKGILRSEKRITTAKTRIIAKNHQMMRIDEEDISDLDESLSKKLLQSILKFLQNTPPDVCIFEDYDKGVLSPEMISKIIYTCNQLNIPVIVDPKKKNFFAYQHCTVFKPNIREINESLHTSLQYVDLTSLNNITTLLHHLRAGKKSSIQKAHVRNVADVSGAGDTVVSVAALCLAAGAEPSQMAAIANIAGGLVCESPGVVSIDKAQLLQECIDLL